MTDNRGSEPNKYAGFLARQNHQRDSYLGIGVKCLCGKLFDLDADHAMHQVDEILRAALVAAARVAPQAECDCGAGPGSAVCKGVCATRAPVLPSSTVDEAALAEVIANAGVDYNLSDRSAESYACGAPDYRSAFLARAIAEHLTGGTK